MIFPAAVDVATYSVGDYVYAKTRPGDELRLSRVESAHALRGNDGPLWLVRQRAPSGWSSVSLHCLVDRALSPAEIARGRELRLIPPAGERL